MKTFVFNIMKTNAEICLSVRYRRNKADTAQPMVSSDNYRLSRHLQTLKTVTDFQDFVQSVSQSGYMSCHN